MRKLVLHIAALLLVVITSCTNSLLTTEKDVLPFNPYDTLKYDNGIIPDIPIDSNSFLGIHKYIMSVRCAQPACHDGSFEPDFRTVNSAYTTLVYAPVFKTYTDTSFKYRVAPGDVRHSWLHERLVTNDPVLGRMPLYDSLPPSQVQKITNWIADGAPDMFGNKPALPNKQPGFAGVVAYLESNGKRVDTIRGNSPVNPMMFPQNSIVDVWFCVFDDDPSLPFLLPQRKVKFSKNSYGFSNATAYDLITETTNYKLAPAAFSNTPVPYFLHYKVNTAQYNAGDIVYMRIYIKDNDHPNATEIPTDSSPFYLQTYVSFVVQ